MQLIGHYSFGPRSIYVTPEIEGEEHGPALSCQKTLLEALKSSPSKEVMLSQTEGGRACLHATWYHTTPDPAKRLLFYRASHKRQRLSLKECRGVEIVKSGGSMVIASIQTDSLLVFRHREYVERVFFDGDRIITRVTQEEAML